MDTVTTVEEVRARVRAWRSAGERIAFVPTMGNLHAGHMSLLSAARFRAERVVASIFVNPLQFGPNDDFLRYPRTPTEDALLLSEAGCDLLFAPTVEQIYPDGGSQPTLITVRGLSEGLCGVFRPGHFEGVATVVAKLFGIVAPDVAIFGEKDFQQFAVISQMTRDLAIPVQVIGAPTVRAPDGLALSSRNRYLSSEERARAPAIYAALSAIVRRIAAGEDDFAALEAAGRQQLEQQGFKTDYFSVCDAHTLKFPTRLTTDLVVLAAVRMRGARLIDNVQVRRP
jgi:pantoate--beta-alanine ligase